MTSLCDTAAKSSTSMYNTSGGTRKRLLFSLAPSRALCATHFFTHGVIEGADESRSRRVPFPLRLLTVCAFTGGFTCAHGATGRDEKAAPLIPARVNPRSRDGKSPGAHAEEGGKKIVPYAFARARETVFDCKVESDRRGKTKGAVGCASDQRNDLAFRGDSPPRVFGRVRAANVRRARVISPRPGTPL